MAIVPVTPASVPTPRRRTDSLLNWGRNSSHRMEVGLCCRGQQDEELVDGRWLALCVFDLYCCFFCGRAQCPHQTINTQLSLPVSPAGAEPAALARTHDQDQADIVMCVSARVCVCERVCECVCVCVCLCVRVCVWGTGGSWCPGHSY